MRARGLVTGALQIARHPGRTWGIVAIEPSGDDNLFRALSSGAATAMIRFDQLHPARFIGRTGACPLSTVKRWNCGRQPIFMKVRHVTSSMAGVVWLLYDLPTGSMESPASQTENATYHCGWEGPVEI
jgi:hypothetical protein